MALHFSVVGGYGNPPQCSCLQNPHGQRSLTDDHPQGCKESDTTERLSTFQLLEKGYDLVFNVPQLQTCGFRKDWQGGSGSGERGEERVGTEYY